ncbi:DUF2017 family protein [Georgenia faecalis]|uniref:DUF2017 family protein n=1 Tax=Georgenia faecalis TaxID=2483799 RepID=A0ABV9DCU1_9MICO|nr:DUF2017 family protein [Georgenia faecalis]
MQAFIPVPGGYACELEPVELRIIARLVADTAELLGTPLDAADDDDDTDDAGLPARVDVTGAAADEAAVLAALDWSPADETTPTDPALARLLPPASGDEALAGEMRRLTEGALRSGKADRLRTVWSALRASSGLVVVRAGAEGEWLAALTDVRLVLASRLGIEDEDDAEAVYTRAGRPEPDADELESALVSLYTALTWWQESLLAAMSGPHGGV